MVYYNNLVLVGRVKETIVLSSGENVEPVPIEEAILLSPYIDQIVLVGQDRSGVGALVVPSKEALEKCGINMKDLKSYADANVLANPELEDLIKKEINKLEFKNINFNKNKVSSVDEFQGREEDIIIVNLVRNNKSKGVSDFVKKLERINVALSRARKMLIVVGAKSFFTRLDIEMESLDDATIKHTKKL